MHDDGGVVRTTRELTAEEQRALVAQCSRCVVVDSSWWAVPATAVGLVIGLVAGGPLDVVAVVLVGLVMVAGQVRATRRMLRAVHPVGEEVETALAPHRLTHLMSPVALSQLTTVRPEGRVLRLDLGRDHTHVLPAHVDAELLRLRAGVPAPEPAPGPDVVVVPGGLGLRAAVRRTLWSSVRNTDVVWSWVLVVVAYAVDLEAAAVTLLLAQVGALLVAGAAERREFDRTFPAGVALQREWRGTELVVRSTQGEAAVPVGPATSLRDRGELVVVRRPGQPPLPLPAVVVTGVARTSMLAN